MSLQLVRVLDDAGRNGNPPLPESVTAIARLVLIELALHVPSKRKEARCSPSIEHLSERTRLAPRTIRNALRLLESCGMISTRKRRWDSNEFTLHLDRLIPARDAVMEIPYRHEMPTDNGTSCRDITARGAALYREPGKNPGTKRNASRRGDAHPSKREEFFDRFWDAYALKLDKADARKAWVKFEKTGEDPERIIEEARWNAENDMGIRPYPATWLNKERWNAPHAVILAKGDRANGSPARKRTAEEYLSSLPAKQRL